MGGLPVREPHRRSARHSAFPAHHRHRSQCRPDLGLDRERGAGHSERAVHPGHLGIRCRAHLHLRRRQGLQGQHRHGRHQRRTALRLHRLACKPHVHPGREQHQDARHGRGGRRYLCRGGTADAGCRRRRLRDQGHLDLHAVGAERADRDADLLRSSLRGRRIAGARGRRGELHGLSRVDDQHQIQLAGRLLARVADHLHRRHHDLR